MNLYSSHATLNLITVCLFFPLGWSYRNPGYSQNPGQYASFGSMQTGPASYCPQSRPFPPNAGKVVDDAVYECLPSYLRNPNAVLDDDDGTIVWAGGQKPDYSVVNEMFNRERTIIHPPGSMEDRISNLMKNWDKELRFKPNSQQWVSLVPDNFYMIVNGGPRLSLTELFRLGSYNAFLGNSEFYSKDYINSSAADDVFKNSLRSGFALEVLEVHSPPPRVSFKFRHWGHMTGPLRCPMRNGTWLNVPPHGGRVEFFGNTVLHLNEKYQVLNIENTFRGDNLMEQMVLGTGNTINSANSANVDRGSWNW